MYQLLRQNPSASSCSRYGPRQQPAPLQSQDVPVCLEKSPARWATWGLPGFGAIISLPIFCHLNGPPRDASAQSVQILQKMQSL